MAEMDISAENLDYIDGYHGGLRGACELGALRDVLDHLDRDPDWSVSFDLEPVTYALFARREPQSFARLQTYMDASADQQARCVATGLFYGQPYLQLFLGESGLRHLRFGLAEQQRCFPNGDFSVYAPQEPCWATWLPQVLPDFGIKLVVLKAPGTAFAGWARGVDAHLVEWQGPDGSLIEAVPRYACEDFVRAWETESRYALPAFAKKCRDHGIKYPTGTGLQDFGWQARRGVPFTVMEDCSHVSFTTWQAWLDRVPAPDRCCRFIIDDFVSTLPYGDWGLHRLAGVMRQAEVSLLAAERFAAMAWWFADSAWPLDALDQAWRACCWAQHHDAWICPDSPMNFKSGRPTWAETSSGEARQALAQADEIFATALDQLVQPAPEDMLTVVNSAPVARHDLALIELDLDPDVVALKITDSAGATLPNQLLPAAKPGLHSAWRHRFARSALVHIDLPAMAMKALRIKPISEVEIPPTTADVLTNPKLITITSRDMSLAFDSQRGGCATVTCQSFFREQQSHEIGNWFRLVGFDPECGQWLRSDQHPAEVTVTEAGPLRTSVRITGQLGQCHYVMDIALEYATSQIDVDVLLDCPLPQAFSDPGGGPAHPGGKQAEHGVGDLAIDRHTRWHDDAFKLQLEVHLPPSFSEIDKSSAWDVTRAEPGPTRFSRWDEAKHRIALQWLDVRDEIHDTGLAVLCDRVMAYNFDGTGMFSVVLGWGHGGRALLGQNRSRLRLIPHLGNWQDADIYAAYQRFICPTQFRQGCEPKFAATADWLAAGHLVPEALEVVDKNLVLRAWNPTSATTHQVSIAGQEQPWHRQTLAAAPHPEQYSDGHWKVPQFGLLQLQTAKG